MKGKKTTEGWKIGFGIILACAAASERGFASERSWTYSYNESGQIATADGPRTDVIDVTTYGYDANANLSIISNPLGYLVEFPSYDAGGRRLQQIDLNGVITDFTYTPRGWLETATLRHPSNSTRDQTTRYAYDAVGQLVGITYPNGDAVTYEYDGARRLTAVEDATGNRIEYTLDPAGNRTAEVVKGVDGSVARRLSRAFDELSRIRKITDSAGQVEQYNYDVNNNLTQSINPRNFATQQSFDALDRVTTVRDPQIATVQYTYDSQDNLTSVTDQRGLTTRYTYDGLGNLTQIDSPDTGITTFTHDNAGNVISRTDARGLVTNYQYDGLNRLVAETYPATPSLNVSYGYDDNGNGNYGIGRLTSIQDVLGTTHYRYDFAGNLVNSSYQVFTDSFATSYAYDAVGAVSRITYPGGRVVDVSRNSLGQITGLATRGPDGSITTVVSGAVYMPFGPLRELTYGNGLVLSRSFNQDYRLVRQEMSPWIDKTYSYDGNGNLTGIQDAHSTVQPTFGYDAMDRLTAEVSDYFGNPLSQSYRYDAVGNRTEKQSDSYAQLLTYATDRNRLETVNGETIVYDATGNMAARYVGGVLYEYRHDERERYEQIYRDGQLLAGYQYNALGQRVSKTRYASGQIQGKEIYHYNQSGQLIATTIENGAGAISQVNNYLWLDDLPVAQITDILDASGQVVDTKTYYLHPDHLNTPRLASDPNQSAVWTWQSDAFGMGAAHGLTYDDGHQVVINLRFPGQYFDEETGLHYNYFRDYDPTLGRYIQSDPIGLRGGLNTYSYVGSNPLVRTDPLGLAWNPAQVGMEYGEEWDELNTPAPSACPSPEESQCVQQCIATNYGQVYTAVNAFNPIGVMSIGTSAYAGATEAYATSMVNRGMYTHSDRAFATAVRQGRALGALRGLNAAGAVAGSFSLPFVTTANVICEMRCQ